MNELNHALKRLISNPKPYFHQINSEASRGMKMPAKSLNPKWRIAKVFFFVLFFALLFYVTAGVSRNSVGQNQLQRNTQYSEAKNQLLVPTQAGIQEYPVHLTIPSIHVDAVIEHVGVTSEGEMAVPKRVMDVGWFKEGALSGEKGNAVIAGHLNGEHGELGVFADLHMLHEGESIYVEGNMGMRYTFSVREIHSYDAGYANEVFAQSDSSHLNLITCSGVWDTDKNSYSKRLVVFADLVE